MELKKLLETLCSNLENELNMRDGGNYHSVKLFSGILPGGYFLPEIGTIKSPVEWAWFVEISVDGVVIFRQSEILRSESALGEVEQRLIEKTMRSVFTFGVMSSKQDLERLTKKV